MADDIAIQFEITPIKMGRCISICPPKKRPRVSRYRTYHEPNYISAQKQVLAQLRALGLPSKFPVPCQIDCTWYGALTADCDNAIGFLLDVLVKGGYLPDDSPSEIRKGSFEVVPVVIPGRTGRPKKTFTPREKLAYWGMVVTITSLAPVTAVVRKPIPERVLKKY